MILEKHSKLEHIKKATPPIKKATPPIKNPTPPANPLAPPANPPDPPAAPPFYHPMLTLTGLCPSLAFLSGTYFLQGMAANGAPYYAHSSGRHSLYYDWTKVARVHLFQCGS